MTHESPLVEKPRLRWMCGRATFTMVASNTTMSWAVRITARRIEPLRRRGTPRGPGKTSLDDPALPLSGREGTRVELGIDYDLSAANLDKRKLPPVSIRRLPPFNNPIGGERKKKKDGDAKGRHRGGNPVLRGGLEGPGAGD